MDVIKVNRMDEVKYVPVSYVRQQLGVSRQRVYQLLKSGDLGGVRIGGTWLVSSRSVQARIHMMEMEARSERD